MNRLKLCKPYLLGIATIVSWCCQPAHASPLIAVMLSACVHVQVPPEKPLPEQQSPNETADAAALPNNSVSPLNYTNITTENERRSVPKHTTRVIVRVLDAADGLPIEGAVVGVAWADQRIRTTDHTGVAIYPSVTLPVGAVVAASIQLRAAEIYGGEEYMLGQIVAPTGWKKAGVPVDTQGLILPLRARSLPIVDAPSEVEVELRVRLDGIKRRGRITYSQESATSQREAAVSVSVAGETRGYRFYGPASAFQGQDTVVGPTDPSAKIAFFRIRNVVTAFEFKDNFQHHVHLEDRTYKLNLSVRNEYLFDGQAHKNDYTFMFHTWSSGCTVIRLSDAMMFCAEVSGPENFDSPVSRVLEHPLPAGEYVVVPAEFSGGPFHLAFYHAVREGIDLAQFGVPIITLNEANPRADLIIDAMEFIDIRRRVEQALKDKRARDAAAHPPTTPEAPPALPAPAPAPQDPSDEPPTPPTP